MQDWEEEKLDRLEDNRPVCVLEDCEEKQYYGSEWEYCEEHHWEEEKSIVRRAFASIALMRLP